MWKNQVLSQSLSYYNKLLKSRVMLTAKNNWAVCRAALHTKNWWEIPLSLYICLFVSPQELTGKTNRVSLSRSKDYSSSSIIAESCYLNKNRALNFLSISLQWQELHHSKLAMLASASTAKLQQMPSKLSRDRWFGYKDQKSSQDAYKSQL